VKLWQSGGQQQQHSYYDKSGTITTGGTAQLLLPQSKSRSHLAIANNSTGVLMVQIGIAGATAVLTGKVVTSVTVGDAGFGFLVPPQVLFLGGGNSNDPASQGAAMPDWPAPTNAATGNATIANGTISAITLSNGGAGYLVAPYVAIIADRTDPTGVGTASATIGLPVGANGGSIFWNGTVCPTDAISIWGATTGQAFSCKWMT